MLKEEQKPQDVRSVGHCRRRFRPEVDFFGSSILERFIFLLLLSELFTLTTGDDFLEPKTKQM